MRRTRGWFRRHIDTYIHGVGRTVYWKNIHHPSFTGYYVVTTRKDANGYIGIYNDTKGHRLVPWWYVTEMDTHKKTHS